MLQHEFVCTFYSYWFRSEVATTETSDIISDIRCWWNYKVFELNLTYRILLHWIGAIKRECNNTVDKFRLNVFEISIVVLYAFLRFHTSAPNWMKLSGSISGGYIHQKSEPIRQLKNSVETLLLSISIALLRSVVKFHTIPVGLIESSFWRVAVDRALMKSNYGNMAQSRSCFWISLSCHSYLPEFAKCAWIQSLSRTVVTTLGLLILGLRNLKLILFM